MEKNPQPTETSELQREDNPSNQGNVNYSKKEFWNERFEKTTGYFDWYADWSRLKSQYTKICNENSKFLMVGCGNSLMSNQMVKDGYKDITNIDISDIVIEKMKKEYPDEIFMEMDATNMTFEDNKFDCVIDKGTLDALMCSEGIDLPKKLIQEMYRVTKIGGYFTIVTHGDPECRVSLFEKSLSSDVYELQHEKIKLSFMSNLINAIRNTTPDHSIKSGLQNKNVLIASILDAFVNSYDDSELTEDQKKAKKRATLQLKLRKMLNKYEGSEEEAVKKIKEEKTEENNEKKEEEKAKAEESVTNGKSKAFARKKHCNLYILKKIK